MDELIEVSLERVREVILGLNSSEFSTADVIRGYCGGFFANTGTPAYYSFNAQFGKLLKRNSERLGIREAVANVGIADDRGRQTSSSTWVRTA